MSKKAVKTEFTQKLSSREVFDMTTIEREAYFTKYPEEKSVHFPDPSEEILMSDMTATERDTFLAAKAEETKKTEVKKETK